MRSAERQSYPSWTLDRAEENTITEAISAADADYVVILHAGDTLSECALFCFAEALQSKSPALLLYADEDEVDPRGRRARPWFKPRWNSEMFYAQDYISRASAIEMTVARSAAEVSGASVGDLMLVATSLAEGRIGHVPHVLVHVDRAKVEPDATTRIEAVSRLLGPLGVTCAAGSFGSIKVEWPLPPKPRPLVSIIVPTRDKLDLLRPCLESVYPRPNTGIRDVDCSIMER